MLVAGAVAVLPQIAQAQDVTPQPPVDPAQSGGTGGQPNDSGLHPPIGDGQMPGGFPGFGRMDKPGFGGNDEYDKYLAEALGISVEELQAARQKADEAMLDQSIADGEITEEQAAFIKARQALKPYLDRDVLMAEALGISSDELKSSLQAGKSIPALIEEQGLSEETFQQSVQNAHKAAVQQAVDDGVITQEIADQILSQEAEHGIFGRGMPGPGRHGCPREGMGMPNSNSQPTQEAGQ